MQLDTFKLCFLITFRRQQDNGNSGCGNILLDMTHHFKSIHYGHHDISYNQIGH